MENTTKGKLIVSTKSNATGRKAVQIIGAAFFVALALMMLANFDEIFSQMGRDFFHNSSTGTLLGGVAVALFLGMAAFNVIVTFLGSKSFCDVYENGVVGKTALSRNQPNTPMQAFDLSYEEIKNVSEAGKSLIIYTNYMKYEVLALNNRVEAMQEIRKRISENA